MMTEGLRRKPTYEEVIDYMHDDPDKVSSKISEILKKYISIK